MSDEIKPLTAIEVNKLLTVQPYDTTQEVKNVLRSRDEGQFKKGDILQLNARSKKECPKETRDDLFFVTEDWGHVQKYYMDPFMRWRKPQVRGVQMGDYNVNGDVEIMPEDVFEIAPLEVIQTRLDYVKRVKEVASENKWKVGDSVQLSENVYVQKGFLFFSQTCVIHGHTPCVIDEATGQFERKEKLNPLRGKQEISKAPKSPVADIKIGDWKLSDFLVPLIKVYFPESETEEYIRINQIEQKKFALDAAKLVLPTGYLDKIMRVCNRVVNRELCEDIYEKLGLWSVCQKGRGALFLLYGPPGTGKTMTAEVVADRLQRPLIRLSLAMFDGNTTNKLKNAFIRAQKYNAVLLLDEVDVFIRKRGDNPMFDENTATFLRTLEYYDGILFMTTNLINTIDPAVFSRVHVVLGFDQTDFDQKVEIWKGLLTPELLSQTRGTEIEHEELIKKLAAMNINGREIKTVIQNAVSHAIYELKGKEVPTSTKWISTKYFLDEATTLVEQRDSLKGGR